jgi:hypothetical protein
VLLLYIFPSKNQRLDIRKTLGSVPNVFIWYGLKTDELCYFAIFAVYTDFPKARIGKKIMGNIIIPNINRHHFLNL